MAAPPTSVIAVNRRPALPGSAKRISHLPRAAAAEAAGQSVSRQKNARTAQMLVQADEIRYDNANELCFRRRQRADLLQWGDARSRQGHLRSAQQAALHAEGNARLTETDGNVTYGEHPGAHRRLPRRLHRFAAPRDRRRHPLGGRPGGPDRGQLHRVPERRLYRLRSLQDDPLKPPLVAGQGGPHHP